MKYWYLVPLLWELVVARELINGHYHCSYHGELIFKPECSGYNCWSVQLVDLQRHLLIDTFNQYRSDVATGTCSECNPEEIYENMFALNWHWRLEYEAQKLMSDQNCPIVTVGHDHALSPHPVLNQERYSGKIFTDSETFEYAATSMPQVDEHTSFFDLISKCLNNRSLNCLDHWYENKFRKAVMNFVGCALVPRLNVTGITGVGIQVENDLVIHMMCVFASPVINFYGITGTQLPNPENCHYLTGLPQVTQSSFYPNLCAYENVLLRSLELPCQVFMNEISLNKSFYLHPIKPCDGPLPLTYEKYVGPYSFDLNETAKLWTAHYKNGSSLTVIIELNVLTDSVNFTAPEPPLKPNVLMIQLKPAMLKNAYDFKFCFIVVLIYIIILSILFLTISLVLKFYVEKKNLATRIKSGSST